MGLLDRLEGQVEAKASNSLELFREIYGTNASWTGKVVNIKTALQVSAVLACARVIAEGIAQVPLKLMRESADGKSRAPAKDLKLYDKLHRKPNFFQTSFEYRETMGLHLVLAGKHCAFINRVGGEVYELLPFEPQQVEVKRKGNTWDLQYIVTPPDGSQAMEIPAEAMWHVRGPSWNGYLGLEAVQLAREAIGLSIATEESQAKLHRNGSRVGGLISVEGAMTPKQYEEMRKWVEEKFEGAANAHRTMILDRGSKFTSAVMSGVDAQHLETRRYQVEEICRSLRVMPIMVGYSDKATTYASAEQMFLAHLVHTLSPWYERIEQSINAHLLTEKDRREGVSAKFIEEGLLRGSLQVTKDFILGLVNGGVITANEGRAKLDMNPDGDPASDKLRVPVNLTVDPASAADNQPAEDPTAKALAAVQSDVQALLTREWKVTVDARSNVDARSTVNVPERAVNVKNKVTVPEREVNVKNEVTVPERSVTVENQVKAYPAESEETVVRDKDREISTIHRRNKD